jgi:hypothetical protein
MAGGEYYGTMELPADGSVYPPNPPKVVAGGCSTVGCGGTVL